VALLGKEFTENPKTFQELRLANLAARMRALPEKYYQRSTTREVLPEKYYQRSTTREVLPAGAAVVG
jgi:hypothetical protein